MSLRHTITDATAEYHRPGWKSVKIGSPGARSLYRMDALFRWLDAALVRQTAGKVARECHAAVWGHVLPKATAMSIPQARGYIRAVGPEFITQEVDAVLARRRAGPSLRPRVVAGATEELIKLIVDNVACVRRRAARAEAARAA